MMGDNILAAIVPLIPYASLIAVLVVGYFKFGRVHTFEELNKLIETLTNDKKEIKAELKASEEKYELKLDEFAKKQQVFIEALGLKDSEILIERQAKNVALMELEYMTRDRDNVIKTNKLLKQKIENLKVLIQLREEQEAVLKQRIKELENGS